MILFHRFQEIHLGCDLIIFFIFYFFTNLIYLFMRDTQREAETQVEGEAGSMQGTQCGTQFRVSRITPWAECGAKPLSPAHIFFFVADF